MNLSIAELRKRNNFTIFRNRIRDNQNFTLNESNGRTIRITNRVYREIGSIDEMIEKYAQGRSIFLRVGASGNQEINFTDDRTWLYIRGDPRQIYTELDYGRLG